MTENCACGAAIKTWSKKWWLYWREHHVCPNSVETVMAETEVLATGFQIIESTKNKNSSSTSI